MSAMYGTLNFENKRVSLEDLNPVRELLSVYGPDGEGDFCDGNIAVVFRQFQTTQEAARELQPHRTRSGIVLAWDGRLDNRDEVLRRLDRELLRGATDVAIVGAAYERWRTESLASLVGDWALMAWDPEERSLVLARDFLGNRALYFSAENGKVVWSSLLAPLVSSHSLPLKLNDTYIAGWFGSFPPAHQTPYEGIEAVPPSCYVRFTESGRLTSEYWRFDSQKRISYPSDSEYEEHFRVLFRESVHRRLRSSSPVLAELSGGLDSSSIVCVADEILNSSSTDLSRLDTVSYYDDSEPNWNERPYFTKVEERRGRTGLHINLNSSESIAVENATTVFMATPSMAATTTGEAILSAYLCQHGHRVLLSGIGGDEVTGGVPTPLPELADLVATGRWLTLFRRLTAWSLDRRTPWVHLAAQTILQFLPRTLVDTQRDMRTTAWLNATFITDHLPLLTARENRLRWFGPRPSFQECIRTLKSLRNQLGCSVETTAPPYERRYPYLDRDLLEFLFAIPREQLVRPGQRRSLMRRALRTIVPDEILNRRRKAYVSCNREIEVAAEWASHSDGLRSEAFGFVDSSALKAAIDAAGHGREIPVVVLSRTKNLEQWLRYLCSRGLIEPSLPRPCLLDSNYKTKIPAG